MSRRALCIEADPSSRERLAALLEGEGFAVDLVSSGVEGLARARTLPPDLVLVSAQLPDLPGAVLALRLRREPSLARVPLVALADTPGERAVALAAGADAFALRGDDRSIAEALRAVLSAEREQLGDGEEREALRALAGATALQLEAALLVAGRATHRLEELAELRRAFVHNVAHELSTPLTPLAGYLRILSSDKLGALPAPQRRIVDAMALAVGRLARVVDNLADFASLDSARAPLREGEIVPDALAEEVVRELEVPIREARLHVDVRHEDGGAVAADPRKLRQALANIVGNAVKFSPHGGEVLVEVKRDAGRLSFAVYDQGPGVGPGEADRIFEPLYHAQARGEEARLPGSGLGLPVARRVAEAHGGRVWVESPPRSQPAQVGPHYTGSKFVLEIPLRAASASLAHDSASRATHA